eukprot:30996-Pelagococcus_subviridis.AAC.2
MLSAHRSLLSISTRRDAFQLRLTPLNSLRGPSTRRGTLRCAHSRENLSHHVSREQRVGAAGRHRLRVQRGVLRVLRAFPSDDELPERAVRRGDARERAPVSRRGGGGERPPAVSAVPARGARRVRRAAAVVPQRAPLRAHAP